MLKIAHRLGGVHAVFYATRLTTWCGHSLEEPEYWRDAQRRPITCPTCRAYEVAEQDRAERARAALIEFVMKCPTEPDQE